MGGREGRTPDGCSAVQWPDQPGPAQTRLEQAGSPGGVLLVVVTTGRCWVWTLEF